MCACGRAVARGLQHVQGGMRRSFATAAAVVSTPLFPSCTSVPASSSHSSLALQSKLQYDALRPAKPARLSQLVVIAESWPAMEAVVTQLLQRELRTRIAHQLLRLQHYHVIPPSKATERLTYLHSDIYDQLCALDSAMEALSHKQVAPHRPSHSKQPDPIVMENFINLMSSIEGRLAGVTETLMEGLQEAMGQGTGPNINSAFFSESIDRFLQARIGIAVLIRHFLELQKGNGNQISEDGQRTSWGAIRQNASIKELVEDAVAEVNQVAEHYYHERLPSVQVTEENGPVHATVVPSHLHHVIFEILKNAYKASVEKSRKENANIIPPVEVGLFKGSEEVCIRIRDRGDGMSLRVLQRAGNYLWSSSVPYAKQAAAQQSYQPLTEPLTGMGIGLPVSRLFAKHFGGDVRVISIKGHGTDVAVYISQRDLPESIPIRCLSD